MKTKIYKKDIEGLNKYIYTVCRYKCSEILKKEKLKWWCNYED